MKKVVALIVGTVVIVGCSSKEEKVLVKKEVLVQKPVVKKAKKKEYSYYIHVDTTQSLHAITPLRYILSDLGYDTQVDKRGDNYEVYTQKCNTLFEAERLLSRLRAQGYMHAKILKYLKHTQ